MPPSWYSIIIVTARQESQNFVKSGYLGDEIVIGDEIIFCVFAVDTKTRTDTHG